MDTRNILPFTLGLTIGLFFFFGAKSVTKTPKPKSEVVKECNRKGAIYSDGVCQHVFAPICRRL